MKFGAFGRELGSEIVAEAVVGAAKEAWNSIKKRAPDVLDHELSKQKEIGEHRDEFFAFIQGLSDEQARDNILRRHREREQCLPRSYGGHAPYLPGDENKLVERLVNLYRHLQEESELEIRKEIFKVLGHMSDEDFDAAIEFLTHDFVVQYLRRLGVGVRKLDRNAAAMLFRHARRVRDSWWVHPHRIPIIGPFINPVGFIRERRNP